MLSAHDSVAGFEDGWGTEEVVFGLEFGVLTTVAVLAAAESCAGVGAGADGLSFLSVSCEITCAVPEMSFSTRPSSGAVEPAPP